MPTTQEFYANIKSTRDNGRPIELNLRGVFTYERGTMENSFESYSETRVTECQVLVFRKGLSESTNKVWATQVDFYDMFSETEQARFLEKAEQEMEVEN